MGRDHQEHMVQISRLERIHYIFTHFRSLQDKNKFQVIACL
jgi:hypothetical protein